jgi:hypothetical protein
MVFLRERNKERMLKSLRAGTGGGGGGGGSMGPGATVEYGHHSHSHWEDDTVVVITQRFHGGHELVIGERLRLETGPDTGDL